jgi:hypothetical protein
MSKLDEELERRFCTSQRPVYVDPSLFTRLVQRRSRRERAKRLGALAFVVGLVAVGAGVFAITSGSDRNGTEPATSDAPSLTAEPAVGAMLPGVPYPACHATTMPGYSGVGGTVYLFARGPESGLCPDVASGNAFLALYPDFLRLSSKPTIFGPIECFNSCRVFGSPYITLKGPELAVVVMEHEGVDTIELYHVEARSETPFMLINVLERGKRTPLRFDWGIHGDYRAGAVCSQSSPRTLDVWHARLEEGKWHVVQQFMRLRGTTMIPSGTGKYATSLAGNLPSGDPDFCDSTRPTP